MALLRQMQPLVSIMALGIGLGLIGNSFGTIPYEWICIVWLCCDDSGWSNHGIDWWWGFHPNGANSSLSA